MQPLRLNTLFSESQQILRRSHANMWMLRLEGYADHASRLGFVLAMLMIAASAIYGLSLSQQFDPLFEEFANLMDSSAFEAGFKIEGLSMGGQKNTPPQDILEALELPFAKSILVYDTERARERLLALGWVEKAEVRRVFPSHLEVKINERLPFARYAADGKVFVIDQTGFSLGESNNANFSNLLLVEGEGAAPGAAGLTESLQGRDSLRSQIERAELVADRFWVLHLKSGLAIKLPRKVNPLVFERIQALLNSDKIAAMDLESIDLRLPHRTVLNLKDATLANRDRVLASLMPGFRTSVHVSSSGGAGTPNSVAHSYQKASAP